MYRLFCFSSNSGLIKQCLDTMLRSISMVSKYLSTDVVCVKCWGDYVLAGVGGFLRVFDISSSKMVLDEMIFSSHNLRGINIGEEGNIIIHGSKEIAIVNISVECTPKLTIVKRRSFDDWILTANWDTDPKKIAAVSAHNMTWLWLWEKDLLVQYTCVEKCMLYCAMVTPEPWKKCVVLGGTVFKEVVLWSPGTGDSEDKKVLHRLCGHDGVIFSINYDAVNNYISTTSDDRSVRLWKVTFPEENNTKASRWERTTITHLHVLYAHTARVWQSLLLPGTIVSVGEDSHLCVWNYSGKLIHKWKVHQNACVWTVDYNQSLKILVTGGSDGAICTWPLDLHLRNAAALHASHVLNGNPRRLVLLHSGEIVCVTDAGIFYKSDDKGVTWQEIYRDSQFANYCLLGVSPDRKKISLASLRGKLVILVENGSSWKPVINHQVVPGKIFACLWLSEEIILTCADEGLMPVFSFTRKSGKKGFELSRINSLFLPPSKERFPTCATLLTLNKNAMIVCGDRVGSLHLYPLGNSASRKETVGGPPVYSLNRIHGCLGTTSVSSLSGNRFLSTGRDGCVRDLEIDSSGKRLVVRTCTRLPADWVAGLLYSGDRRHQLAICYKESDLIVWAVKERRPLVQVWCAGGHRSLDCIIHKGDLRVSFVQNKMIWGGSWPLEMKLRPSLQVGLHPREVNCAYLTNPADFSSGHKWVFTGGEDGTIRLLSVSCSQGDAVQVTEEAVLSGHISSIRTISMVNHPKIGRLVFSAGGRAQLKAWQFVDDSDVYCCEISSHMLMGSDRRKCNTEPTMDPETRYMSISCLLRLTDILIVAGCSDGYVRILEFRSNPASFQLIAENDFHGKCVLSTCTFRLFDGRSLLLTSATDGQIALWDLSSFLSHVDGNSDPVKELKFEPFWNVLVHQTGVNAVDVTTIDRHVVVASGGDDSSVVLTALEWETDYPCPSVAYQKRNGLAHSAQVIGVRLIGNVVVTTSTDQRVTLWRWSLKNGLSCDILLQHLSSVADLQGLQVWLDGEHLYALIVGRGMQVLQVDVIGR